MFSLRTPLEARARLQDRAGSTMGLVRPLVALALLSWVTCGEPGAWEVPPPSNVTITSYNLNTSIHWGYRSVSVEPVFTVAIRCYIGDTEYVVDTCVNISQHYCDLTHKISLDCAHCFWAKVKAVSGSRESSYASSEQYNVIGKGLIGPPKLSLSVQNDEIHVSIEDPLSPYSEENYPLSVRANISDLSYDVFMRPRGNSEKRKFPVMFESCEERSCTTSLPVQTPDIEYCVSAKGTSDVELITAEESYEICTTPTKQSLDSTWYIVGGSLFAVLITVFFVIFLLRVYLKQPNIKLPKSLVTVVRSIKPSEINPESKSAVSIYKPVKAQCEVEDWIQHADVIEELQPTVLDDCSKVVRADDSERPLGQAEEMSLQGGTAVEIPESEHSLEACDNYSKSVSGQEEPCHELPSPDLPRADVRQPTNLGICRNVSGYDKPHWGDSNPNGEAALVV